MLLVRQLKKAILLLMCRLISLRKRRPFDFISSRRRLWPSSSRDLSLRDDGVSDYRWGTEVIANTKPAYQHGLAFLLACINQWLSCQGRYFGYMLDKTRLLISDQ